MNCLTQRFTESLGTTQHIQRPVNIPPEMVCDSGLLKDLIIVHCPQKNEALSDMTLLESPALVVQEKEEIALKGGRIIRRMGASRIQDASRVKVMYSRPPSPPDGIAHARR